MTQSIKVILGGLALGGSGIVTVLVIIGIALTALNIETTLGKIAIFGGVFIGLALGALGVFGVIITTMKRLGIF